jgi:hypothetical protein
MILIFDFFDLIIVVFLAAIILIAGIIYLCYWIPNKFKLKTLSVILPNFTVGLIILYFFYIGLKDSFITKDDVNELLKPHGFILEDDFEINSNKTDSWEYFSQELELTVSDKDKLKLIRKILQEGNQINAVKLEYWTSDTSISQEDTFYYVTFIDDYSYGIDYYKTSKVEYKYIKERLTVEKLNNKVYFRIERP